MEACAHSYDCFCVLSGQELRSSTENKDVGGERARRGEGMSLVEWLEWREVV